MPSLRTLTVLFLTTFAGVTAGVGTFTYRGTRSALVTLVDRRVDTVGDAILSGVAPGDAGAILRRIDAFSRRRDTGDVGFLLTDAAGRRLGGNIMLGAPVPPGFSTVRAHHGIAGLSSGRAERRDVGGGLTLTTVIETEPIDGYSAVRARYYLLGFGLIAIVVVAGTGAFGLIIRRRIREVRTTAEAIIDGDLTRRVPVEAARGAFAEQAATFNRMLDRIAALVDDLRHVSSDVAHDLRMPLSRLRQRVEAMPPGAAQDEAIAACDDLLALFAAILRIADIEGGERRRRFGRVDLSGLVEEVMETLGEPAADAGHRLVAGPLPPITIIGDRQLLGQALYNLAENSLHHTPPGTTTTIRLEATAGGAAIMVADDGPGIPPADRATALRRFGRLDRARTTPGHGLGLPLVDAIARLHGGSLTLADARPGLAARLEIRA